MLTNEQIQTFADSLTAVGVIKTKQKKALGKIMPDKGRSAAYAVQLENAFERLKKLEHDARARGYREAEMKIIRGAVDAFTKFAKRNVEHLQNREVTALGNQFDQFENQFIMISYEEGENIMNIRENAQQIVSLYLAALPTMEADTRGEKTSLDMVKQAKTCIEEIAAAIDSVADGSSENAAKLQKQVLDAMNAWANEFANGNFSAPALATLKGAVTTAKSWASLKAPAAKTSTGIFSFLNKGAASKEAPEGTYHTAEAILGDLKSGHHRIHVLSEYPNAKAKVEAIARLIDRTRAGQDDSGMMALKQQLEVLNQEKAQLAKEQQSVACRFMANQTDLTLATQLNFLQEQIKTKEKQAQRLTARIHQMERSRVAEKTTLSYLEQTYFILTQDMEMKSNLVSLASYVNCAVLNKILEKTASPEEMTSFVQLDALVNAAQSMGLNILTNIESGMDQMNPILEGMQTTTSVPETMSNGMSQADAQALAAAAAIAASLTQTQPAEQTVETPAQTTGGISLEGTILGNDT